MPASKLDKYLNILQALIERPRKIEQIESKVSMDRKELKRRLDFLVSNGVVEQRRLSSKQTMYALNDRGFAVFRTLRAFKYIEKLKDALPIVEEAREIASTLSKRTKEWKPE